MEIRRNYNGKIIHTDAALDLFVRVQKMVASADRFFLVLLGGLIILTKGSALAPFIYAIF